MPLPGKFPGDAHACASVLVLRLYAIFCETCGDHLCLAMTAPCFTRFRDSADGTGPTGAYVGFSQNSDVLVLSTLGLAAAACTTLVLLAVQMFRLQRNSRRTQVQVRNPDVFYAFIVKRWRNSIERDVFRFLGKINIPNFCSPRSQSDSCTSTETKNQTRVYILYSTTRPTLYQLRQPSPRCALASLVRKTFTEIFGASNNYYQQLLLYDTWSLFLTL